MPVCETTSASPVYGNDTLIPCQVRPNSLSTNSRRTTSTGAPLEASLPVLIESVKAQGLEGLVAKRLDSRYEAGLRSGAWQKMRVNRGQEFVIGDYTVGTKTFDALVFGYYEGGRLIYAARTRNGFTPVVREQLFKRFRGLEIKDCPFVNLPERRRRCSNRAVHASKDCSQGFVPTVAGVSLRFESIWN